MREEMIMSAVARRSSMALFSSSGCHYSHRVRIVLAEKSIPVELIDVREHDHPRELTDINPYNSVPTLADRDLVLYESKIILEYLDERFPHPPLLPVYPVARGESRQLLYRIERDWCPAVDTLLAGTAGRNAESLRKNLRDGLLGIAPIFAEKPFFMSEEFSLIDCCMAPILWRLRPLGVELPDTRQAQPLRNYMDRLFARPSFKASLTPRERDMAGARAA
jgi:RNA polymerase-associated protein